MSISFQTRRTHYQYDAICHHHPDYSRIRPLTAVLAGEVAAFAQILIHLGRLPAIQEQVRFARFGTYDTIDFVVVLIGYVLSGEPPLKAFYERLKPFAETFMALFGRSRLPDRSTLSRFLAALDQAAVEGLRTLFLADPVARSPFATPGGLSDRQGDQWWVIDVDATKQAARQRALPCQIGLPAPHRRLDQVCAPGYLGRKRGEVARSRTTVLQAFTHQWIGTYGGSGYGNYRGELKMLPKPTRSGLLSLPHRCGFRWPRFLIDIRLCILCPFLGDGCLFQTQP